MNGSYGNHDGHNGHDAAAVEHNGPKRDRNPEAELGPLKRSAFRALVQDFSPIWFTWSMNSGIIAILLHQHPYRFHGIDVLADIFFVLDLVLFVVFSTIFTLRILLYTRQCYSEITSDITQLCLMACWTIAFLTLCELIALIVSPTSSWGGRWATLAAYSLWWVAFVWMLSTLFVVFVVLTRRSMAAGKEDQLPPLIIIPAVGVTTLALSGAIIVRYGVGATADLAVPAIITGLVVVGIGIVMGSVFLTLLWRSFLVSGFPPAEQIASLFLLIGPMGQSAAALIALGDAASNPQTSFFATYNHGTFITLSSALSLSTACTLLALLLLGNAALFFFYALYAMLEHAFTRQLKWALTWNSIIFPTGTMTTATTLLSIQLDSRAFRVLTAIQLIFLVIVFLVNLGFTGMNIFKGEMLIVREDPRVKKQLEELEKEK